MRVRSRLPPICGPLQLYERLFDHSSEQANPLHFYHVLLLAAIVALSCTWLHVMHGDRHILPINRYSVGIE